MATKLSGRLNLSLIPKDLIQTAQDGSKFVWIDVLEKLNPGKYGETHTITVYNKNARQTVYLADLKQQEFGKAAVSQPAPKANYRQQPANTQFEGQSAAPQAAPAEDGEDLPF